MGVVVVVVFIVVFVVVFLIVFIVVFIVLSLPFYSTNQTIVPCKYYEPFCSILSY